MDELEVPNAALEVGLRDIKIQSVVISVLFGLVAAGATYQVCDAMIKMTFNRTRVVPLEEK